MKKESMGTEELITNILAFVGILTIISFVIKIFDNSPKESELICDTYIYKIDELESEMTDLEDEIDSLENQNYELKQDINDWKEEYNDLEKSKGCSSKGSATLKDGK